MDDRPVVRDEHRLGPLEVSDVGAVCCIDGSDMDEDLVEVIVEGVQRGCGESGLEDTETASTLEVPAPLLREPLEALADDDTDSFLRESLDVDIG